MSDFRTHANYTTEVLRDLVGRLIVKHEHSVLEVMHELKKENHKLQARIDAALRSYELRSELFTNDADLIASLVDTLRGVVCAHKWKVTQQGQTYMDSRCSKCGATKRDSWD
jgi:hypothetical protein